MKWCRNKKQANWLPCRNPHSSSVINSRGPLHFYLKFKIATAYEVVTCTCIYGQTFPGAQNSSCLPSHWHSVSAIRKENKNQYYSEPTLDGPFKTWHRCERVALVLYGKRFLLTSCLLLFNISIFSMAFLDETLLLSLSNWRYNNDFEISM